MGHRPLAPSPQKPSSPGANRLGSLGLRNGSSRSNPVTSRHLGLPIPPAPAQGDQQRGVILETQRLGLDIAEPGLLVLVIRGQDLQIVDQPGLIVGLHQLQGLRGRGQRRGLGLQRLRVVFHRPKRVGHLLEGADDIPWRFFSGS